MRSRGFLLIGSIVFTSTFAGADEVTTWNNVLLNAVRTASSPPPVASRSMAMVSTAVYDAVNSIDQTHQPYHYFSASPTTTSREAAAAQAAHDVLTSLYPAQSATFTAQLTTSLGLISDSPDKAAGISLGSSAAASILALRSNDNSTLAVTYAPGGSPGDWTPTPPANAPALLPNWPQVTPWAMTSGSQFRAPAPPAYGSAEYNAEVLDVQLKGDANAQTLGNRSADETEYALFWADGAGTATPPGHWNRIAQTIVETNGSSIAENARTFALLNMALADAAISAWDTKYEYDGCRPITEIRTLLDPAWTPLITTPPFPTYTSGHSTFSAAASSVLASLFGEATSFDTFNDNNTIQRSFTSFSQAAAEAGMSRIYGGIHFMADNLAGLAAGQSLGEFVFRTQLQPVPEPATWSLFAVGITALSARYRRARSRERKSRGT